MITLTPLASSKVLEVMEAQNIEDDRFLRIGIMGGGCSGLRYGLAFDNEFDPLTDTKFSADGVDVVTRKKFAEFLDGTVVDFKEGPMGSGFAIENPNFPAGAGCAGCGGH
ncbi:MAG: iron-sulfur cluster assembly accessory protein [Planctomycetia bacterium]|nr:iron-sulfur cluster assembly accessory protein [Planctomycetia bacterium]